MTLYYTNIFLSKYKEVHKGFEGSVMRVNRSVSKHFDISSVIKSGFVLIVIIVQFRDKILKLIIIFSVNNSDKS